MHLSSLLHINEKAGRFGGTEEYIESFSQLCARHGIASYLIYGKAYGQLPETLTCYQAPGVAKRKSSTETVDAIERILNQIKPRLVYIHNIFDERIAVRLNKPQRPYLLLWYVHDHYFTCLTELRSRISKNGPICERRLSADCLEEIRKGHCLKRFLEQDYSLKDYQHRKALLKSLLQVDIIIVVSEYMEMVLIDNLPGLKGQIKLLPRQVRISSLPRMDMTNQTLHLAFSGRINREKGLHVALNAMKHVSDDHKILFSIAGVIEDELYWQDCRHLIDEISQTRPSIRIEYLGFLPYEKIDELYRQIHVLIVPSIWGEPSGTVGAEALSHGAAVIASNIGGISMWIRHQETGLLVEPNNPKAIASAVERLAKNSWFLKSLATRGKLLIHNHFTAEKHFDMFMKTINSFYQIKANQIQASNRVDQEKITR